MVKTLTAKTVLILFAIAWLSGAVTPAHSEIRYTNSQLTIKGDSTVGGCGIQIRQMNGVSLVNKNLRTEESLPIDAGQEQSSSNSDLIGNGDPVDTKKYVQCSLAMDLTGNYPAIWGNDNIINYFDHAVQAPKVLYAGGQCYKYVDDMSDAHVVAMESAGTIASHGIQYDFIFDTGSTIDTAGNLGFPAHIQGWQVILEVQGRRGFGKYRFIYHHGYRWRG